MGQGGGPAGRPGAGRGGSRQAMCHVSRRPPPPPGGPPRRARALARSCVLSRAPAGACDALKNMQPVHSAWRRAGRTPLTHIRRLRARRLRTTPPRRCFTHSLSLSSSRAAWRYAARRKGIPQGGAGGREPRRSHSARPNVKSENRSMSDLLGRYLATFLLYYIILKRYR